MEKDFRVPLFDMVLCLSHAIDLVSPIVANHHQRTAYIAMSIARVLHLSGEKLRNLVVAGALHDVGGLSLAMRVGTMQFEVEKPHEHAELGYLLLKTFRPFTGAAEIVRYHHVRWEHGKGTEFRGEQVPMESRLLHLADRVAVLLNTDDAVLTQADAIFQRISAEAGKMFDPDLVAAFAGLAGREYFWLDAVSPAVETILSRSLAGENLELGADDLLGLTRLFCRIIDFRSPFTSTHTSGVAACAEALARLQGFSESDCRRIMIAGFIHDLGKLAVPAEILDKPAGLSRQEFDIIRTHAYHSDHVLRPIRGFDTIRKWGALHHERLSGCGYPYHLEAKDLSLGSRIMSVADVFVAITEDRPYRKGMDREEALRVLTRMVQSSALDGEIVELLVEGFDQINAVRIAAQKEAAEQYRRFVIRSEEIVE